MKYVMFFLILAVFLSSSALAEETFSFKKEVLYIISYKVSDSQAITTKKVYFKSLKKSPPCKIKVMDGNTVETTFVTYAEFQVEHVDSKSIFIPLKNIVEIKEQ